MASLGSNELQGIKNWFDDCLFNSTEVFIVLPRGCVSAKLPGPLVKQWITFFC